MTHAKNIFSGRIRNRDCPKALGYTVPLTWDFPK
jgi:hypothetical protein